MADVDQADLAAALAAPLSDPSGAPPAAGEGAPGRPESFSEAWERLSEGDGASDQESDAAPAEAKDGPSGRGKDGKFLPKGKAAPAPAKAEPPKAAPAPSADKLAQLRAIAAELGLEVDDAGPVSRRERIEWRRSMKAKAENLAQREAAIVSRIQGMKGELQADAERFSAFSRAAEDGDYEGMAKAIGKKGWDEVIKDVQAHFADPSYKKVRELEAKQQELERREAEALERQSAAVAEREQSEARQAVLSDISAKLAASTDPLCRELHDHPLTQHVVFQVMQENWDHSTQSTVSPARAVRMATRGAKSTFEEEMRDLYGRLHRAFGAGQAGQAAPSEGGTARRPSPRSAPVPPRAAPAPSVASWTDPKSRRFDDRKFEDHFRARIGEAAEADRKRAASGR